MLRLGVQKRNFEGITLPELYSLYFVCIFKRGLETRDHIYRGFKNLLSQNISFVHLQPSDTHCPFNRFCLRPSADGNTSTFVVRLVSLHKYLVLNSRLLVQLKLTLSLHILLFTIGVVIRSNIIVFEISALADP